MQSTRVMGQARFGSSLWARLAMVFLAASLTWGGFARGAYADAPPSRQVEQQGRTWSYIGYGSAVGGAVIGVIGFMVFSSCVTGECSDGTLNASESMIYLGATSTFLGVGAMAHGSFWQARGIARQRREISRIDGNVAFILSFPMVLAAGMSWYFYAQDSDGVRISTPIAALAFAGTAYFGLRQHVRNGNWNFIPVRVSEASNTSFAVAPMLTPEGGAGIGMGLVF